MTSISVSGPSPSTSLFCSASRASSPSILWEPDVDRPCVRHAARTPSLHRASSAAHRPPSRVFVDRHGRHELTPTILTGDEVRELVERMLKTSGRRLDRSQPFVDALLPGGHRLHVVLEGISRDFAAINIRKFVARAHSLDDLVSLGTLNAQAAALLRSAVIAGLNVVVSGGINVRVIGRLAAAGHGFTTDEDRRAVSYVLEHRIFPLSGLDLTMAKVDVDDLKRQGDRWLARELGIADEFGWDYGPYLEAVPRKFPRGSPIEHAAGSVIWPSSRSGLTPPDRAKRPGWLTQTGPALKTFLLNDDPASRGPRPIVGY